MYVEYYTSQSLRGSTYNWLYSILVGAVIGQLVEQLTNVIR